MNILSTGALPIGCRIFCRDFVDELETRGTLEKLRYKLKGAKTPEGKQYLLIIGIPEQEEQHEF